jgi:hypothetical protein
MEIAHSSDVSASVCEATQYRIPEDHNGRGHDREDIKTFAAFVFVEDNVSTPAIPGRYTVE